MQGDRGRGVRIAGGKRWLVLKLNEWMEMETGGCGASLAWLLESGLVRATTRTGWKGGKSGLQEV
jgi:hypothetical protein